MKQIITKKLEDKEIVWFQEANRYLLVEHTTADIITDLSEHEQNTNKINKFRVILSILIISKYPQYI